MGYTEEHGAKGQILIIFALMLTVLMGMAGLAIDVAHARAVAEDAQRAADAGALAGVVYLPGSVTQAESQAAALSTANGFTATSTSTPCPTDPGTVCISYAPDASRRILSETITVRVQTWFLRVLPFGLNTITVVRTAKATYDDPIALGAPDHMLGFAPYPTKAIQSRSGNPFGQGFYLEVRGPYTGLEHGDAFSPYFTTANGDKLLSANNPSGTGSFTTVTSQLSQSNCATYSPGSATTACGSGGGPPYYLVNNPYYNGQNTSNPGQVGYNFIFSLPPEPNPVLIKILDPYDECNYQSKYNGVTVYGPNGHGGRQGDSSEMLDQCTGNYFDHSSAPTTLRFTLYQPAARSGDNTLPITPNGAGMATDPTGANAWTVQVGPTQASNGYQEYGTNGHQDFGADPAAQWGSSPHGFQWFTLAEVWNKSNQMEYLRLSVQSVQNADATFGQGGNNFALAVCKTDGSTAHVGDPTQATEWVGASINGSTADPGGQATSYDTGCADPNVPYNGDGYGCPNAGDNTCYHVNAREAFCLETLQPNPGPAFIPIAQLDSHLAGSTITIRLFDAGDINGGTNVINVLGPQDDPTSFIGTGPNGTNANGGQYIHLDISAPAQSGYSPAGRGRDPMPWWGSGGCPADYSAFTYPNNNGGICPPLNMQGVDSGIYAATSADGNIFANDTWLNIHVTIPSSYNPSPTNEWWKVYYNLTGSGADDTTTWQVVSGAAPVHLLTGQ